MTPSTFEERRLLVIDLDGTLLNGDDAGRQKFSEALGPVRNSIVLVYVSGRSMEEELKAVEDLDLPTPDYVVSSVGTEIHRLPGEHFVEEWYRYVQGSFDREAVIDFLAERFPELDMQAEEHQTALKVSYFWEEAPPDRLDELRQTLLHAPVSAKMVYSSNLYLDIIPERAGIGAAVKFLVDSLVLAPNQVFVCGNSENDIDLFQYGFRGIVLNNASRSFKKMVELRAYFSHKSYASGLLEGLEHYKFFSPQRKMARQRDWAREGLGRAIDSLRRNITSMGFSAASLVDNPLTDEDSNYFSIWSRDGIKTGLWSLSLNDTDINECFRRTLLLLCEHQADNGQIPANVRIRTGIADYGGIGDIASIDSVIWFVIGCARYAAYTQDREFLDETYPNLVRAMQWLHAHDSNHCGLLEIPESSDWMDLFPRSYNVLYDQVLWYQACRDFVVVADAKGDDGSKYTDIAELVQHKISHQFWPTAKKLSHARESFAQTQFTLGEAQYLLAQISPFGFSWRCDVYANLLASLMGLLDEHQMEQLFQFLWGVGVNAPYPVKCYYPVINSGASDWKDYFVTNLLNLPHHYHNGGIWPFIGGLWVRFLAQLGRVELAHQELNSLARSCHRGMYGQWEFNEWLHGHTGRPMGKAHQAWSAASYIAAYKGLYDDIVPSDFEVLTVDMFGPTTDEDVSAVETPANA